MLEAWSDRRQAPSRRSGEARVRASLSSQTFSYTGAAQTSHGACGRHVRHRRRVLAPRAARRRSSGPAATAAGCRPRSPSPPVNPSPRTLAAPVRASSMRGWEQAASMGAATAPSPLPAAEAAPPCSPRRAPGRHRRRRWRRRSEQYLRRQWWRRGRGKRGERERRWRGHAGGGGGRPGRPERAAMRQRWSVGYWWCRRARRWRRGGGYCGGGGGGWKGNPLPNGGGGGGG